MKDTSFMLPAVLIAAALSAVTVAIHAVGLSLMLWSVINSHAEPPTQPWPITRLFIRMTWWLIVIHVVEITIWALFYLFAGHLPDAESAFYFSAVTYTTIGYGDVVLAKPWRILGPVEGLTGILMCGLSTGLFFATVMGIHRMRNDARPTKPTGSLLR